MRYGIIDVDVERLGLRKSPPRGLTVFLSAR